MKIKHREFEIEINEVGALIIREGEQEIFIGCNGEKMNILEQSIKASKEIGYLKDLEERNEHRTI